MQTLMNLNGSLLNHRRSAVSTLSHDLRQRVARIEMLLLDVDGVMTDGGLYYADGGGECQRFHVRDGMGLKLWRQAGKRAGIITGRTSRAAAARVAELRLEVVVQGADRKLPAFQAALRQHGLGPEQVAYAGDDLPDVPVLAECGLAVAVADACPEVVASAHYVTKAAGGHGAVREIIELILRAQGLWRQVVDRVVDPVVESIGA